MFLLSTNISLILLLIIVTFLIFSGLYILKNTCNGYKFLQISFFLSSTNRIIFLGKALMTFKIFFSNMFYKNTCKEWKSFQMCTFPPAIKRIPFLEKILVTFKNCDFSHFFSIYYWKILAKNVNFFNCALFFLSLVEFQI